MHTAAASGEEDNEEDSEEDTDQSDSGSDLFDQARVTAQGLAGASGQQAGLMELIQLKLLKEIKGLRRSRRDGSSSSGSDDTGKTGSSSKLRGVLKLRRRIKKHPGKLVKQYTRRVRERLCAEDDRVAWSFVEHSKGLVGRFGKMRGLWRAHWMFSRALDVSLSNNMVAVQAHLVQACKCLHQVALDKGAWTQAQLLLADPDPLAPEEFAGETHELLADHAYFAALNDLKKNHQQVQKDEGGDEEGEAAARPPKKK